ncbi:Complement C1q-like protein 4 [Acipenser ruthenus]|uniref:Complement C1q-like protein 4 n=1 Tax=Acipenser ruthenus TaxID=7906 RepID=A0A662YMC4_ACIRT|nr:Complement C1q-like protein 4 [Acipenser ruthenus]
MKGILMGLLSFYILALSGTGLSSETNNNSPEICCSLTKDQCNDLAVRLTNLEYKLKATSETPKIVFSAILFDGKTQTLGPFNAATTLVFAKVLTNIGSAYNSNTGIFTALVPGTYYFSFTVFFHLKANLYVTLMKNADRIVSVWDNQGGDTNDSGTHTVTLQLAVGDHVYVRLNENKQLYDDANHYNSFSGFLLFPL